MKAKERMKLIAEWEKHGWKNKGNQYVSPAGWSTGSVMAAVKKMRLERSGNSHSRGPK